MQLVHGRIFVHYRVQITINKMETEQLKDIFFICELKKKDISNKCASYSLKVEYMMYWELSLLLSTGDWISSKQ
jgi:hypothetical protein